MPQQIILLDVLFAGILGQRRKKMEKHLVAQWTYKNLLGKGYLGERIYRLSDGSYIREQWVESETNSFPCSHRQFGEILERREFPFRGPINEPRQPKWCLG